MEISSKKFIDDDSIEKKFIGAKNTQDCIQSVAIWALTNKNQHDQIVSIWLNSIKKSKVSRRLTLFYICNEIVQTCRRKHALIFKDAFKEVLKDATLLVRDKTVCDGIERMFNIWKERDVFEEDFIAELLKILKDSNIETASTKLLSDFKLNEFIDQILSISQLDEEIQAKAKKMQNINVDSINLNYTKLLKDRQHGFIYTKQVEEFQKQMTEFVAKSDQLRKSKEDFINDLDFCSLYYEAQYGEARIVANAYRSFGNRIRNIQKKLGELRRTLPDPLSPLPSPSYEAPSPPDSINDCMSPLSDHPLLPDKPLPLDDITEPVDMEFSDDEATFPTQSINNGMQISKNYLASMTADKDVSALQSINQSISAISNIPPSSLNQIISSNLNGIHEIPFNISLLNSNIKTVANNNFIEECKNININWDTSDGYNPKNIIKRKIINELNSTGVDEIVDLTNDDMPTPQHLLPSSSASDIFRSLQILAMSMKVPITIDSQNEVKYQKLEKRSDLMVNASNDCLKNTLECLKNDSLSSQKYMETHNSPKCKIQKLSEDKPLFISNDLNPFNHHIHNTANWKPIKIVEDVYDDDDDAIECSNMNKNVNLMSLRRSAFALENQKDNEPDEPNKIFTQIKTAYDSKNNNTSSKEKIEIPQINTELIQMIIQNISSNQANSYINDYIESLSEDGELKEYSDDNSSYRDFNEQIIEYGHGKVYEMSKSQSESFEVNTVDSINVSVSSQIPMPPPPPFLITNTAKEKSLHNFLPPPVRPQFIESRNIVEIQQMLQTMPPSILELQNYIPRLPFISQNNDFQPNKSSSIEIHNSSRLMSPKDFHHKMMSSPPLNHTSLHFNSNTACLEENNANNQFPPKLNTSLSLPQHLNLVREVQYRPSSTAKILPVANNSQRPIMHNLHKIQSNVNFRPMENMNITKINQQFQHIRPLPENYNPRRQLQPEVTNSWQNRPISNFIAAQTNLHILDRARPSSHRGLFIEPKRGLLIEPKRGLLTDPPRLQIFEQRSTLRDKSPHSNFFNPKFQQNIRLPPR